MTDEQDKPRVKVTYKGEMTPEIQAWIDKVEAVMNEHGAASVAIEARDRVAAFGSAAIQMDDKGFRFIDLEPGMEWQPQPDGSVKVVKRDEP